MTILGFLGQIEFSYPEQYQAETLDMDLVVYFCHRMANVITKLFTDQELTISDIGMQRFFLIPTLDGDDFCKLKLY
ncbi:hypothetical protein J4529_11115 [Neisseria subflava]|nr:hypothetical protein [Neisseria subflava]